MFEILGHECARSSPQPPGMPVTRLTCPHCEAAIELQVSGVTRSRACPKCGEMVILQVAEKDQKVKRRALLMEQNVVAPAEPVEEFSPQPLLGDALERMKMDPELLTFRKRLLTGLGVLTLLIAAAVAYHFVPEAPPPILVKPVIESSANNTEASPVADAKSEVKPPLEVTPILPPAVEALKKQEAADAAKAGATETMKPDLKLIGVEDSHPKLDTPLAAGVTPQANSAAEEALLKFLRAKSIEERLAVTANVASWQKIVRQYYSEPQHSAGEILFKEVRPAASAGAKGSNEFLVVMQDGSERTATVLPGKDGYKVDWPSFVLWNGMTTAKFRATKPTQVVEFRVTVEAADKFGGAFADGRWLQCLKVKVASEPDAEPLFAYVDRKSQLGNEVSYWLQLSDSKPLPMTVRLRFPVDAAADDQVWLDKIAAVGWVVAPSRRR